jgi:hypothetical protein
MGAAVALCVAAAGCSQKVHEAEAPPADPTALVANFRAVTAARKTCEPYIAARIEFARRGLAPDAAPNSLERLRMDAAIAGFQKVLDRLEEMDANQAAEMGAHCKAMAEGGKRAEQVLTEAMALFLAESAQAKQKEKGPATRDGLPVKSLAK